MLRLPAREPHSRQPADHAWVPRAATGFQAHAQPAGSSSQVSGLRPSQGGGSTASGGARSGFEAWAQRFRMLGQWKRASSLYVSISSSEERLYSVIVGSNERKHIH